MDEHQRVGLRDLLWLKTLYVHVAREVCSDTSGPFGVNVEGLAAAKRLEGSCRLLVLLVVASRWQRVVVITLKRGHGSLLVAAAAKLLDSACV